jgi:hypothetical protein
LQILIFSCIYIVGEVVEEQIMLYVPENFNAKEKAVYLKALVYVFNLSNQNKIKREYLLLQLQKANISQEKYEAVKSACKIETLIDNIRGLDNLRAQRFIIREMVMLALADQDVTDDEIRDIYQIAESSGISSEKVGDFFIWAAKGIEWQLEGIQLVEEDL